MTVERDVSPSVPDDDLAAAGIRPRTKAGRELYDTWPLADHLTAILAIEQEAADLERRRTVERIKARIKWRTRSRDGASVHWVTLEEVSALLEEGA